MLYNQNIPEDVVPTDDGVYVADDLGPVWALFDLAYPGEDDATYNYSTPEHHVFRVKQYRVVGDWDNEALEPYWADVRVEAE